MIENSQLKDWCLDNADGSLHFSVDVVKGHLMICYQNEHEDGFPKCLVFQEPPEGVGNHFFIAYVLDSIIWHCFKYGPEILCFVVDGGADIGKAIEISMAKYYFVECVGAKLVLWTNSLVGGTTTISANGITYKICITNLIKKNIRFSAKEVACWKRCHRFKKILRTGTRLTELKNSITNPDENVHKLFDGMINLHTNLQTSYKLQ